MNWKSNTIKEQIYWIVLTLLASYIFISVNSSFRFTDPFIVCRRSSLIFLNITVTIQLGLLLFITKLLFQTIQRIEDEKWRLTLVPIVLFAFPVSVIILWMKFVGC